MQNQTDTRHIDTETGEIIGHSEADLAWELGTTDEQLLGIFAAAQQEAKDTQEWASKLEQELMRRAKDRGATTIYGQGMKFIVETEKQTDWSKMPPVLEFLTPEEKEEAFNPEHTITVLEHIIPEHEELIPSKWAVKGTVMKLLRRHGDEAVAAANSATFPGKTAGKLIKVEKP